MLLSAGTQAPNTIPIKPAASTISAGFRPIAIAATPTPKSTVAAAAFESDPRYTNE
jgi:hypothetical protein